MLRSKRLTRAAERADGATHWEELPGFGETRSAMTVFPVTAASNLELDGRAEISHLPV